MSDDDSFWNETVKGDEEPKPTEPTPKPKIEDKKEPEKAVVDPFSNIQNIEEPVEKEETVNEVKTPEVTTPEPTQTVDDPFSTPTPPETVETPKPVKTETPQPPQIETPFGTEDKLSQNEEFARTKPANSGKNISFMIFGKKGTSKTSTALSLPGKIFAISMDQQTRIIHEQFFNNNPRIEVWDGIEFFNSKSPEIKLETATKTVEYINWLLENPCVKFEPDWILIDGTERLSHVCEMAMRAQENLLPYEGVKNLNAWKYRNDLINNVVQRATQIAKLGVIFTAYTSIETVTTATGEEKREGPKWAGDIEQKTQIVIKTSSGKMQNGRAFVAEVESSKVSFIPTGRRIVVGERLNTGEIQNNIGIKGLFTPEGVKKYFSGGE